MDSFLQESYNKLKTLQIKSTTDLRLVELAYKEKMKYKERKDFLWTRNGVQQ